MAPFDVFTGVPEHLIGRHDVVHIRTFAVIVRNNDPVPLLSNLIKVLSKDLFYRHMICFVPSMCRSLDRDMSYVLSNVVTIEPGGDLKWDEIDLNYISTRRRQSFGLKSRSRRAHGQMEVRMREFGHHI